MQIHVARGGQTLGVFSPDEVRTRLASGEFQAGDLGWTEGQAEWTALSALPGLATSAPPPIPTATDALPPAPASAPVRQQSTIPHSRSAAPTGQAISTAGTAIASLILGILSITILPLLATIPAVICGHVAQSNIKKSHGRLKGGGMALAGLIMGYFSIVMLPILAILAGIALPVFSAVQLKGKQTQSLNHGKQIAILCRTYAADHDGAFPKSLEDLIPDYVHDPKLLVCPLSGPTVPIGYEYYGGKDTDPPSNILLVSKSVQRGGTRIVVHVDTSGEVVKGMPELPPHSFSSR